MNTNFTPGPWELKKTTARLENEYLLASIAEHKLHALQVANTDPSPYTVTAMVLPDVNDYDGSDVIGFVFRALRRASSQFDSADQVFNI